MKTSVKLASLAVVLLLIVLAAVDGAPSSNQQSAAATTSLQRLKFNIPKLLDFELYKRIFNKSYSGLLEHMVRAKYFMSRSIRAFVSALKYSHGEQSYFLSVNFMTDYVPSELEKMRNKVLDSKMEASKAETQTTEGDALSHVEITSLDGAEDSGRFYRKLVQSLETRQSDPLYAEMLDTLRQMESDSESGALSEAQLVEALNKLPSKSQSRRKKRDADELNGPNVMNSQNNRRRRKLPLDRLINLGANEHLPPETLRKISTRPKSNNPNYEAPELSTMGMIDQQVPVEIRRMTSHDGRPNLAVADNTKKQENTNRNSQNIVINIKDIDAFLDSLKKPPTESVRLTPPIDNLDDENPSTGNDDSGVDEGPDEVFTDLRDSNCMFLPRNQGQCGSCYAFATIALMEYLYCKKTGKLVAFSEQYVIDCGKQYYGKNVFGCSGGHTEDMPAYLHNFGLELRSLYPYRMREDQCPYEAYYDLQRTGFIRTDIKLTWEVPVKRFSEVLKFTPILLSVSLAKDFTEYGGGVHPNNCEEGGEHHAMLLVGHGREDGQEYWLVRNSHSVGWGEGGYYKMSKKSRCIDRSKGWIFGTSNGRKLDLLVRPNHGHDEDLIQEHYFRSVTM